MTAPAPKNPAPAPPDDPLRHGEPAGLRADALAIAALGLAISLSSLGHFAKPHSDFYPFRETGHALLSGRLPESFKRAPVFPLVVAAAGSVLGAVLPVDVGKHPDVLAAEWLNALLLPLNAVLLYLIGRRFLGGAARWAAAWFLLVPMGIYCTAHAIAEPLLIAAILLTVYGAQRGAWWAYAAAAAASMTRFDAAGAILGLLLFDLLRGRRLRPTVLRAAAAGLPLLAWLVLTAATWRERSCDHYVAQFLADPRFDLPWAAGATLRCVFEFGEMRLRLPALLVNFEPYFRWGIAIVLGVLAVVGGVVAVRRREAVAIVGGVIYVSYTLVHAAFPFQELRFGYPLTPFFLLAGGIGLSVTAPHLERFRAAAGFGYRMLALAVLLLLISVVVGEADSFERPFGFRVPWAVSLPVLAAIGVAVLWAMPLLASGRRCGQVVLLLSAIAIAMLQIRTALPRFGWGGELQHVVESARWIAKNTRPEQRVLSAEPGALRLYAGLEPHGRFLGFEQIQAQTWPEILAECRALGIDYIIWHDQHYAEHGGYYAVKMRFERFDALADPATAEGVTVERGYANYPNLWIFRVKPAP